MLRLGPSRAPAAKAAPWRHRFAIVAVTWALVASPAIADNTENTIERVKGSVVAVGTFERTRAPEFQFRATGFAVGDGSLIATNAHALPVTLDGEHLETLSVLIPSSGHEPQRRAAREFAVDNGTDLALLK